VNPPVAILLAAGVGKRFGAESASRPKGLLEVGGETLLARLVRQLRRAGVQKIVLVGGYGIEHLEAVFGADPQIQILRNERFERGAILSLHTAADALEGPALVMDADVFGPDEMLARLVGSAHENCFLLDPRAEASGEEQMLMVREGRVLDIARIPRGRFDRLGESVGFLKLGAEAARILRALVAERVEAGDIDLEHEEVYPTLLARVVAGYETVEDLAWTEIDFPEDLERARDIARGGASVPIA
jgi:choline kinase